MHCNREGMECNVTEPNDVSLSRLLARPLGGQPIRYAVGRYERTVCPRLRSVLNRKALLMNTG